MNAECLPITAIPGASRLFRDVCAGDPKLSAWYGPSPRQSGWHSQPSDQLSAEAAPDREAMAALLAQQNAAIPQASAQIERLRQRARVMVTGQQVGLLGGPAFTIHKAATAIALAGRASQAGFPHVPVFWLASEDHDFAEVNHVTLPSRRDLVKLRYSPAAEHAVPVGGLVFDESIVPLIDQAWELIGYSDAMEWLAAAYQPGQTMAGAFAEFYRKVFAEYGMLVLDAAGRDAHRLGSPVLRAAIERADELHHALQERNRELETAGYHAQVAVATRGSLLFLLDAETGARHALKRTEPSAAEPAGLWQAGREQLSTEELLGILQSEPERISPSALLRPLFQDTILPTSAYVGGPAEVAYFAQSAVLYERILGKLTPVVPRLSATLIEPAIAQLLDRHELSFEVVLANTVDSLVQRLAARAMPIEGKRKLAAAGNALDGELTALIEYLGNLDAGLGRSALVSASKMRYQMNRLRRMAANFELQKEVSLGRHAEALEQALYPLGHLQERLIGAAFYLGRYGTGLMEQLVQEAEDGCPGHKLLPL